MVRYFYFIALALLFLSACSTTRYSTRTINHYFTRDTFFNDHFTGFLLYDPATHKNIYEYNSDHFFTPASNTKILTLFGALKTLKDSIPSIKYDVRNDTMYIWGMGDPTTLNPEFENQNDIFQYIAHFDKPVIFCNDNFHSESFGEGWAWDDYLYSYQAEKSAFPLFGNLLHIKYNQARNEMVLLPEFSQVDLQPGARFHLHREPTGNQYNIQWPEANGDLYLRTPLHMTDSLLSPVFSHYVNSGFKIKETCGVFPDKKIKLGSPLDTVYAALMQHSNNFIAEQLLLTISGIMSDTLDTKIAIRDLKNYYLQEIAGQLQWYDGSGLSRYNQFTPRAIVKVLEKIYGILSQDQIKRIFPAGGQSGTIRNWYANDNGPPFIYAKTGTLRNVHCLSGYLFTKSGKMFIFSFMHNNFKGSSNRVKVQMDKILRHIKDHY